MLANDEASRAVWLGSEGALAAMRTDAVAIESSTLTVEWIRELAAAAKARGIAFLDAPVTGSKAQAESGALSFLVGGPAEVLERVRPALAAMAGHIAHLGATGSGAMMKLINNFLCGVQVASLAEAIAMAERSGLDARQAAGVLSAGSPGSPLVKIVAQRMLDRAYEPNFFIPLMAEGSEICTAGVRARGDPIGERGCGARALCRRGTCRHGTEGHRGNCRAAASLGRCKPAPPCDSSRRASNYSHLIRPRADCLDPRWRAEPIRRGRSGHAFPNSGPCESQL